MQETVTKLIGLLLTFKQEQDRSKKAVLAKQVSNICSLNFRIAAKKNQKLAQLMHPLIALGYFQVHSDKFDPNEKELDRIIQKLIQLNNT
ncbi:hypothetical protein KO317_02265 [Candidatus Micrarchaeota archaeon]|nr:hypothetical protein [Candidatus Micrarchaeota archaeon]